MGESNGRRSIVAVTRNDGAPGFRPAASFESMRTPDAPAPVITVDAYMSMRSDHATELNPFKVDRRTRMNRRNLLTIIPAAVALAGDTVGAQQPPDVEGVKKASKAFYAALAVIDNGEAMEKVFAHTPYVTFVGPRSKSIVVGWDALSKY